MKATVGNSIGMTISPRPYESIRVESTFHIEKDVKDEAEMEALFDKVGQRIMKDLEEKMKAAYNHQVKLKKMLN